MTLSADSIRLGVMPPLTGLVAMYGQEIIWAAQIACQEVNESGGVLGKTLELFIEDDGSLPESAVAAAKTLLEQHQCVAIIGNLLSNSRIAVAYRVAEPYKIPYLNFSFYEGSISSRYFFHFAALPNQQIDKMIPYMQKLYGSRMFFAGNNYEWPRGSIDAAKRILEKSNGQVAGEEYYAIGITPGEIEQLLDNVAASGADVFVPYFAGIDQVRLLVAFTSRGLKKRMAVVMGHYDEVMVSHLPPEVREGFYSSNTYFMSVDTPKNHSYLQRLATWPGVSGIWPLGNGMLTNFGEGVYLCVKAFAQAANQAGSVESEALIDALETIRTSGPQGVVDIDPVTHHAKVNTYLSRCQSDGTFKIIEQFGLIEPKIPERYRHWQVSGQKHLDEDIRIQARMLEQMTDAAFLIDAKNGAIVYTNTGSESMFGYGRGELIGKHVSALNAPSDKTPEEIAAEIDHILYRKGVWRGELGNVKKDGSTFWCSLSVSAFTHPVYGEVWMSVYKDISEQKRVEGALRVNEERLKLATSAGHVGIWDWDVAKNVLTWDDSMYALYGIGKEDYGGTYDAWIRTLHADDRQFTEGEIQAALRGEREYAPEFRILRPDGAIRHIKASAKTYRDLMGVAIRMVGTNFDITDLKRIEGELRKYKDHLEEEVQQRTADLVLALNAADTANRAKSVFLANMSHELRTPLNAILGFSGMMHHDAKLSQGQRENLDIINRSGEYLLALINDVLEMAKIEAGRMQLESAPIDLGALVLDVTDMMQLRAQEKGLQLRVDQSSEFPRYIRGDEARLRQILINLVGNAVKFTRQGRVSVRFGMKSGVTQPCLLIEVEDTGPGIRLEDKDKIFEPFVQVGEVAAQKGTGLGLTITRQFVQLMGGTISLESTFGLGATFRVALPVELACSAEVLTAAVKGEIVGLAPGQPERRILIVEDQLENQLLLSQMMARIGLPTMVAGNGEQAVALFECWHPDLIWMDRRMPVMDGLEAARRIRALPGGMNVKIVAVTASAFKEQRDEMLAAGMDDFVRKPYRFNEIYESLSRQLGVQYVYAEAEDKEAAGIAPLTACALSVLPAQLRCELHDALESLEDERISAIIGQIGDANLQKSLTHLVDNYDYPAILKALQTNLSGK